MSEITLTTVTNILCILALWFAILAVMFNIKKYFGGQE